MANYSLTTFSTRGSLAEVLAAIEAELEAIDTGKTIRLIDMDQDTLGSTRLYVGYIIYDT
jgi:hypothetical protein